MTENHCDCTVFCGDDPWLKDGRSQPCDSLKRHEAEKSELRRLAIRDQELRKFYSLPPDGDLVGEMENHIKRLQDKLAKYQPRIAAISHVRAA